MLRQETFDVIPPCSVDANGKRDLFNFCQVTMIQLSRIICEASEKVSLWNIDTLPMLDSFAFCMRSALASSTPTAPSFSSWITNSSSGRNSCRRNINFSRSHIAGSMRWNLMLRNSWC